jgi:AraC-like DNA-binding protein
MSSFGHGPALVATFDMASGERFDRHTHDRHQLVWAASGVVVADTEAGRWVLPPSRALWIPAGVPHETSASGQAVLRSVYLDPSRCPVRWVRPTAVGATPLFAELVGRLDAAGLTPPQRRRTEAVLVDLMEPLVVTTLGSRMPTDPRARDVARALLAEPGDQRSLDRWAVAVGASARTLARLFRHDTGVSFGQWRTSTRMQAALPLLGAGEPVSRVAGLVGYESASAFVSAFRRATGVTPGEYFGSGPA